MREIQVNPYQGWVGRSDNKTVKPIYVIIKEVCFGF